MNIKVAIIILTGFLLSVAIISCGENQAGANGTADHIRQKLTDVKVMTIKSQNFTDYIQVTGTVNADIASVVSAEEPGVIEVFVKDKGDWVKKGDVVVRLKSEVLQANFEEAKASYLLSKATFERQANLFKDNVVSEQQYLDHKYKMEMDRARYENLKARLDKTEIKSPISGVIDDKLVEVGEFVQPGAPIFKVVKTDLVKILAGVPERYIDDIRVGSTASVTFDVIPGEAFSGTITFVGPSIEKMSRTFPIEIQMPNPKRRLKPGMFANVEIKKAELRDVVVVPRDALIETESGKYVFVANGSVAEKRAVTIGSSQDNQVTITSGLRPGEDLIIVGHRDLVDGEKIAVHQ